MNENKIPAAATAKVLVAVGELRGGTIGKDEKRERLVVADGEELTREKAKALGLDKAAITDLVERGKLATVTARTAEPTDAADLAALTARAEKAEARVAALEKELAALKSPAKD